MKPVRVGQAPDTPDPPVRVGQAPGTPDPDMADPGMSNSGDGRLVA